MADQNTKTTKQERPNKDEIKGLPAHAQYQFRQGTWYVYFPYCFREDGKRKQERDYIGTLSPDGKEFLPNLYYVQNEPDFDHRPVERWKSPVMRQRALEKLNANKVETIAPSVSLDPELDCDQQLSVGATALCASILNANGMLKNVGTVLDNNPELTMACINLAMHSAITTDKIHGQLPVCKCSGDFLGTTPPGGRVHARPPFNTWRSHTTTFGLSRIRVGNSCAESNRQTVVE